MAGRVVAGGVDTTWSSALSGWITDWRIVGYGLKVGVATGWSGMAGAGFEAAAGLVGVGSGAATGAW